MPLVSTVFHLLIPSRDGTGLLVCKTPRECRLPSVLGRRGRNDPEVSSWTRQSDILAAAIFSLFSIRAYPRRCAWYQPDVQADSYHFVVVLELDSVPALLQLPSGLEWVSKSEALKAKWADVHPSLDMATIVTELFAETVDRVVPDRRPPWRSVGWFEEVCPWILSVVKSHNFVPAEDHIEPVRNTTSAVVLRCAVHYPEKHPLISWAKPPEDLSEDLLPFQGVYVKVSLPVVHEAEKTAAVASLVPDVVPKVLSISSKFNAMVQLCAVETDLTDSETLDALWNFQERSLHVIDELKASGLPDRGPAWLASSIEVILDHPALHPRSRDWFELQGRIGEIMEICETLLSFRIPQTLVHGDFLKVNMGVMPGPKRVVNIFDWNTCCIGHPLYDLTRVTTRIWNYGVEDDDAIDSYLKRWEAFETRKNIRTAVAIFPPLIHCQNLQDLLELYDNMESLDQKHWLESIKGQIRVILRTLDEGREALRGSSREDHVNKSLK